MTTKDCPYCGVRYEEGQMYKPASHTFYRYCLHDDVYVETCEHELAEWISRNMHSRYTDKDGKPK